MAGLDAPRPSTNRPGAAAAIVAADIAISAGPRVNTGTTAVPSRRVGSQAEARASGTNASLPLTSADHRSVYPQPGSRATSASWSSSEVPPSGTVKPQRPIVAPLAAQVGPTLAGRP